MGRYRHGPLCGLWRCSLWVCARFCLELFGLKTNQTLALSSYDTGTISGILAMPYWQRLFSTGYIDPQGNPNITTSQESAVVSILSAGTFFGALASPFLTDWIGRRPGLLISTWVFNLGVVLHTAATSLPLFLAGRFFAGLGVGLISAMGEYYR